MAPKRMKSGLDRPAFKKHKHYWKCSVVKQWKHFRSYAITLSTSLIRRSKETNFIIFSDSTVKSWTSKMDSKLNWAYSTKSLKTIPILTMGKWFLSISNHANIPDNERADAAAKSALSLPIMSIMKLSRCDLIPHVSKSWRMAGHLELLPG